MVFAVAGRRRMDALVQDRKAAALRGRSVGARAIGLHSCSLALPAKWLVEDRR